MAQRSPPQNSISAHFDADTLVLRIDQSILCDTSATNDVAVGKDPNTAAVFEVLEGKVEHMRCYGQAGWLLDVCHGIFDPIRRQGSLFTPNQGTVLSWAQKPIDMSLWRKVHAEEPLEAQLYQCHSLGRSSALLVSKWRSAKSKNSEVNSDLVSSTALRERVSQRDEHCIVTGADDRLDTIPCIASHLIPRRLGEHVKMILKRYVDILGLALSGEEMDPRLAIWLDEGVNTAIGNFHVGFYRVPASLRVHAFCHCINCIQGADRGMYALHLFFPPLPDGRQSTRAIYGQTSVFMRNDHPVTIASSLPNGIPLGDQLVLLNNIRLNPQPGTEPAS
jgi:hypothetical protein